MKNIDFDKDTLLKIILSILIVGGFIYVYLSYFWIPFSKKIDMLEKNNLKMERDIMSAKAKIAKHPDLQAKLSELKNQKEELKKKIPPDKNISELFRVVKRIADNNSVVIELISPLGTVNETNYFRITYNISVKGSYHNIGKFFGEIATQDRIINIENLTISGGEISNANFILVSYQYMEGT